MKILRTPARSDALAIRNITTNATKYGQAVNSCDCLGEFPNLHVVHQSNQVSILVEFVETSQARNKSQNSEIDRNGRLHNEREVSSQTSHTQVNTSVRKLHFCAYPIDDQTQDI